MPSGGGGGDPPGGGGGVPPGGGGGDPPGGGGGVEAITADRSEPVAMPGGASAGGGADLFGEAGDQLGDVGGRVAGLAFLRVGKRGNRIVEERVLDDRQEAVRVGVVGVDLDRLGEGQPRRVEALRGAHLVRIAAGQEGQRPTEVGDRLRVRLTAKQKTLRIGAGYGEVRWDTEVTNQDNEVVAAYDVLTMVAEDATMQEMTKG